MARTLKANSTEALAGLVDRVTFHNSDNGFCGSKPVASAI
jgi:hypothetical protein